MEYGKIKKLVTNLHDKTVIHILNLNQALNHGVIKSNKKDWLKPYIDINTELG